MTTTQKSFPDATILDVDLTSGKISKRNLSGDIYKLYPGGSALGLYLILQEQKPNVDPFSPDNLLVFSVSPLTGLSVSGTSRLTINTKSPLTGGCGDSQAGGNFPAYLKANGYDAIVVRGKSKKPSYIYITGQLDKISPPSLVEIPPISHLSHIVKYGDIEIIACSNP